MRSIKPTVVRKFRPVFVFSNFCYGIIASVFWQKIY